jgi:hypothetical protein
VGGHVIDDEPEDVGDFGFRIGDCGLGVGARGDREGEEQEEEEVFHGSGERAEGEEEEEEVFHGWMGS